MKAKGKKSILMPVNLILLFLQTFVQYKCAKGDKGCYKCYKAFPDTPLVSDFDQKKS